MTKKSWVSLNQFACQAPFSGEANRFKIQPSNLTIFKELDTINQKFLVGLSNGVLMVFVSLVFTELLLVFQFMLGKRRFNLQATVKALNVQ